MLETVIQSLLDALRSAFPAGTAYTHAAFSQAPMPPPIAHFLNQTLHQQIEEALEAFAQEHPWMNFQNARMKAATVRFTEALGRHAALPAGQWDAALEEAVKRVVPYLIRPTHTLAEFLFHEDEGPATAAILHRRLDYFNAYPYLKGVVETCLERGLLTAATSSQRNTLLMQVDQEVVRSYRPDQWCALLEPVFQVMQATPMTQGRGIPVSLLQLFFRDKNLLEMVRRLALVRQEGVEFLDERHLERLLSLPVQEPPAEPATTHPAKNPPGESQPADSPPVPPATSVPPTPAPATSRPLWQQFSHLESKPEEPPSEPALPVALPDPVPVFMVIAPPVPTTPAAPLHPEPAVALPPPPEPPAPAPEPPPPPQAIPPVVAPPPPEKPPAEPASVPLWMRFMRDRQPPPSTALPELHALELRVLGRQGASHRDQFVRHLFSGSLPAYTQALHHLEAASDWPSASRIIAEEVFRRHRVNIYSDPAVLFTNTVEGRFQT